MTFVIGIALMVVAAVGFGLSSTLAKLSYADGVTVMTVVAGRAWLALIALVVIAVIRRQPLMMPRAAIAVFLFTAAANTLQNPAILSSFSFIPVSLAILIIYLFPIIVSVVAPLIGHEKFTLPIAGAALVAFAGVGLILEIGTVDLDWRGMLLAFLGACCLASNVMGAARMNRHMPSLVVPLWLYTVSVPVYTVTLVAQGGPALPTHDLGWIALAGAMSALPVALICFYAALPRAGPSRAALVMNFEPLFTVLLATAILGEILGPMQIAGGALIICAVFYVTIYGRR